MMARLDQDDGASTNSDHTESEEQDEYATAPKNGSTQVRCYTIGIAGFLLGLGVIGVSLTLLLTFVADGNNSDSGCGSSPKKTALDRKNEDDLDRKNDKIQFGKKPPYLGPKTGGGDEGGGGSQQEPHADPAESAKQKNNVMQQTSSKPQELAVKPKPALPLQSHNSGTFSQCDLKRYVAIYTDIDDTLKAGGSTSTLIAHPAGRDVQVAHGEVYSGVSKLIERCLLLTRNSCGNKGFFLLTARPQQMAEKKESVEKLERQMGIIEKGGVRMLLPETKVLGSRKRDTLKNLLGIVKFTFMWESRNDGRWKKYLRRYADPFAQGKYEAFVGNKDYVGLHEQDSGDENNKRSAAGAGAPKMNNMRKKVVMSSSGAGAAGDLADLTRADNIFFGDNGQGDVIFAMA